LPETRAQVDEYRQHAAGCLKCGHVTRGSCRRAFPPAL
jgi:hypothetical protein